MMMATVDSRNISKARILTTFIFAFINKTMILGSLFLDETLAHADIFKHLIYVYCYIMYTCGKIH